MSESRKIEMVLDYQNSIEFPPVKPKSMYAAACSSDTVTMDSWREIWIKNVQANHKKFGGFKAHSLGRLFGQNQNKPAIVIGSGPSLAYNGEHLKENKDILTVSCLHNYHFFEDKGVNIDYFVTLDAGPVVLEEVWEGGTKTEEEYWNSTKNKKLCAFIGTDPKLFEKWQGEIYLFNAPVPDAAYIKACEDLEPFHLFISNGGNVLGACLYIAKAIFGSSTIAFMGADFSFGYNTGKGYKFHGWDSKYDANMGTVTRSVDVFGNKALTWTSYLNFKYWFDYICLQVIGLWVNCTEGGIFGAYPEGNLMAIKQMPLNRFIEMHRMNEVLKPVCEDPSILENRLLF